MKKLFVFLPLLVFLLFPTRVLAQPMMGSTTDDNTASEEVEGRVVWNKLQAKEVDCKGLTDDNYVALGEYFMGQAIGDTERHAAMNQMMISMMGEEGEEQMHIVMGKRFSGCEPDAPVPQNMMGGGMMSMMMGNFGTNPMGSFGWGFSWIFMILLWGLVILGIVVLVKWIVNQRKSQTKSALDILKERYAKGEINKKEFEEKKKDLG